MDGMRSVVPVPVLVDDKVAGPGPCMEPRDGLLNLKNFLKMRFISLMMIKVNLVKSKQREQE